VAVMVTYWILTLILTPIVLSLFGLNAMTMTRGM